MEVINTEGLSKSIRALDESHKLLSRVGIGSLEYEIYRYSTLKCFEISLELSGKLLKKKIKPYFSSIKELDQLTYKDIFRYAFRQSMFTEDFVNRWFEYRDNRNDIAHDYGEEFAEKTVKLLDKFIQDANQLVEVIKK